MGNVLVLLNLHGCDRQEAVNQTNTLVLIASPNRNFNETKEPRSTRTSQTQPPMKNSHLTNGKRRIFLNWREVNSRAKQKFKYK